MSVKRTCKVLRFDRSTCQYVSRRTDPAVLNRRIKEICETRVRYGYRRVHYLLRPEGWPANVKKVHRIYHAMRLQLRNKSPKRRVKAKLKEDRSDAVRPNDVWVMPCPIGDCASAICRKGLRS